MAELAHFGAIIRRSLVAAMLSFTYAKLNKWTSSTIPIASGQLRRAVSHVGRAHMSAYLAPSAHGPGRQERARWPFRTQALRTSPETQGRVIGEGSGHAGSGSGCGLADSGRCPLSGGPTRLRGRSSFAGGLQASIVCHALGAATHGRQRKNPKRSRSRKDCGLCNAACGVLEEGPKGKPPFGPSSSFALLASFDE
jgi:hypothetical protein